MNVRIVFGAIACILSSTLYASEVSDLVAISSDENATSYLLSDIKRVEASAKDTSSMKMESKEVSENNEPPKIIYASETVCIRYFQIPNVYVYPSPVDHIIYIDGVDEEETHLTVYDMEGNCLLGEYCDKIDVTTLQQGTYILCIDNHYVQFKKA